MSPTTIQCRSATFELRFCKVTAAVYMTLQAWFIVPVAIFFISISTFLIFAPLLDAPLSPLIALAFLVLGVPVYFFLVMQSPWKIRPRIFDRISGNKCDGRGMRNTLTWIFFCCYFQRMSPVL